MSGILQGVLASIGAAEAVYIEDTFSTWLYTGNGTTRTITNGIDLAGKGGLVWTKARSTTSAFNFSNGLFDTARGATRQLVTNNNTAEEIESSALTGFLSTGYTLGADTNTGTVNNTSFGTQNYVSWTFREQAKFFDIVTYTGNDTTRNIAHSLGSVPGMMIIKRRSQSGYNWYVYHRSLGSGQALVLEQASAAFAVDSTTWGGQDPTSTTFRVGSNANLNETGATYVAYLFAHNAGGFGASGNENVISCGSFTTDGAGAATVSLGYEPQYVLIKNVSAAENWKVVDVMRGFYNPGNNGFDDNVLFPNLSNAESAGARFGFPTATGFNVYEQFSSNTYIYMAIRRGPMKTPALGTSVFNAGQNTTSLANQINGTIGPVDLTMQTQIPTPLSTFHFTTFDRLRGSVYVTTSTTNAETTGSVFFDTNSGVRNGQWFSNGGVFYNFRRAPGFFDVVCYTGNAPTNTQITHNLGVIPELIIVKSRSTSGDSSGWAVYHSSLGINFFLALNNTDALVNVSNYWSTTAPTATTFGIGSSGFWNNNGTEVAYLFATLAGVSKVGSYTGTGGTQTINAGLPTGARFVLIKRTDSTGNWWVWDIARGMVAGTDPRIALNVADAQINQNWVLTTANGFEIVTTDATVNASGGTYIYLAIA